MKRIRMNLIGDDDWEVFPHIVASDEEIPRTVTHTFSILHAICDENQRVLLTPTYQQKVMKLLRPKTFREHLRVLRRFCLITTMKTSKGTYIELLSPWIRYTKLRKGKQYGVDANRWVTPLMAQYFHFTGLLPSLVKKLPREQQSAPSVEGMLRTKALEIFGTDIDEDGYSYFPSDKYPGVYDLIYLRHDTRAPVRDNSYLPSMKGIMVRAYRPRDGETVYLSTMVSKETKVTRIREVNTNHRPEHFDAESYAAGARLTASSIYGKLWSFIDPKYKDSLPEPSKAVFEPEYPSHFMTTESCKTHHECGRFCRFLC